MNAIRAAMTIFLVLVLTVMAFGWRWSASLPSDKLLGARVAFVIVALASLLALGLIWSVKPRKSA